jgi:general secretion pathway protein K
MMPRLRKTPADGRGLALVTVLWLLALLTLLASAVVSVTLTSRRAEQWLEQAVQADLAADAGIRITQLQLINHPDTASHTLLGASRSLSFAGIPIEVTVDQEAGRIDLNEADPQLLYALLATNGWEQLAAQGMVARISAWREQGARRFESLIELRQIEGNQQLNALVLDALTVYSHQSLPLQFAAGPAVLKALQWADAHQLGGHRWMLADTPPVAGTSDAQSLTGQVLRMRSCTRLRSAARCRRAIVRPTGHPDRPFQVFEWGWEWR